MRPYDARSMRPVLTQHDGDTRVSPRPLDFLSSEYQDSVGGVPGSAKPHIKTEHTRAEDAVDRERSKVAHRSLRTADGESEQSNEWIDAETVHNILEQSKTRGLSPGKPCDLLMRELSKALY